MNKINLQNILSEIANRHRAETYTDMDSQLAVQILCEIIQEIEVIMRTSK